EDERTIRGVHADAVARPPLALEQRQRELVDQLLLDHALERARAEGRVVAQVADQRLRVVGQLDLDAALGDALGDLAQLQLDDLLDLFPRERVELDDLVQAVDELRLEARVHALDPARDVRGHDQHGVLEADRAAVAVGQAAVVHDLEQDVEDVGMRLLDLVEQHDAVGTPADRLCQLAALVVADVARRRADEASDRVLLMYADMSMRTIA